MSGSEPRAARAVQPIALLCSLFALNCALPLAHAETGFLAQQAQLAWQERDKPGETELAIQLWEQAAKAEPRDGTLWIHLAKAMGRAVRHADNKAKRREWADRARAAAEKAVQISPASADAYAVLGEALGQWANAHKGLHSLSVVRQAVETLEKAVSLDPKHAYAHMLLAEFYRQSPRLFSIGDKGKALEHAQKAVAYGPGYAIHHLVLAKAYLDIGKKELGIQELKTLLALSPPADAVPETRADQETAKAMLKSLGVDAAPHVIPPVTPPAGECTQTDASCSETRTP